MFRCNICKNDKDNTEYTAREMMFGYRDKFTYFQCSKCGCLQIGEIPKNLEKYYPSNYYSIKDRKWDKQHIMPLFMRSRMTNYWINGNDLIGLVWAWRRKKEPPNFIDWFKGRNIRLQSKILDVGSGSGDLLMGMRKHGFRDLTGMDPYLSEDIFYDKHVRILKREIYDLTEKFDFIIFNGSFEHIPDPSRVLIKAYDLLKPSGFVLLRIPIVESYAWEKYGVDWIQLDPPRHLFLFTIKCVEILAAQAGFSVKDIVFDSYDFQFWGSEQYIKDIPLFDPRSHLLNPENSIFSKKEIEEFKKKADEVNKNNYGDQARFYLYKK